MFVYKCRFVIDEDSELVEVLMPLENDPAWAACEFADKIYSDREMYEHGDDWGDGDYAVLVVAPDGTESVWSIFVDMSPAFTAGRVEG
jgi:hypothetical protein